MGGVGKQKTHLGISVEMFLPNSNPSLPNPVLLYTTYLFGVNGIFHYKNETAITIEAK